MTADAAHRGEEVTALLERARAGGYEVWAPAPGAPEGWAFIRYDGGPLDLDGYLLTTTGVKAFFLPQRDAFLTYEGDVASAAPTEAVKRAVFCVRPCDARAFALLDKIYAGGRGFHDPAYEARRANTVLIACACEAPAPTCFCTSTGGGPADAAGADVMLYACGAHIAGEATSARGDAFLSELGFGARAPAEQLATAKAAYAKVAAAMPKLWDMEAVRARLYENFGAPAWDEVAARCISCLACSFVCPSCYCFDVGDEGRRGRPGVRLRLWDGCTVPSFTLHASGHNPRTTKGARWRQRVLHKFHYFYDNWGETLCVGCGRCVVACPANVDIREAVALVAAAEK